MISAMRNPEMIEKTMRDLNIPPSHQGVYRDHFKKVFDNDMLMNIFADEVMEIIPVMNLNNPEEAREFGFNYSSTWFIEKAMKGMSHLESSDIRELFRISIGLFQAVPPRLCSAMIREELTAAESMRYEIDYLTTRPQSEVRSYLSILRKAVSAEITEYPTEKTLTPTQRQILDDVFTERLVTTLNAHPNSDELWAGMGNPNALSDRGLCDFTTIIFKIAANEKGEVGDWMVRYILQ